MKCLRLPFGFILWRRDALADEFYDVGTEAIETHQAVLRTEFVRRHHIDRRTALSILSDDEYYTRKWTRQHGRHRP